MAIPAAELVVVRIVVESQVAGKYASQRTQEAPFAISCSLGRNVSGRDGYAMAPADGRCSRVPQLS